MSGRPAALIFRKRILPWSETFVAAQAGAMTRHAPVLVGYERDAAGAAHVRDLPVLTLSEHSPIPPLEKFLLKWAGRVPRRWLRAVRAHEPVIVHAHFGSSAVPASHVARACGVPLVVTYHGMDITVHPRSEAEAERRRRGFAAADRAIAVSGFIADALRAAGCPPERIVVHHIGVDTALFHPPTAERAVDEVLFVGRLVEKKGLLHLVRALGAMQRAGVAARLVVAGDGPLRGSLEAEAATQGLDARFLGVQTSERVRSLMQHATVLCGPSIADARGNQEGLPITFLEAQACGLPIVVSKSGGSAEALEDGETGFLVEQGDEIALAARLTDLLRDAALRARMGEAARARIERHFDLARQTAALEALYDEVRQR